VFSLSDEKSYENLDIWYNWAMEIIDNTAIKVVVGTHLDKERRI